VTTKSPETKKKKESDLENKENALKKEYRKKDDS